jgi:hypothetical protein
MSIRRKRKKKDTNSKKYSFEKRMFCCSNGLYLRLAGVTSGLKAEGKQMIYIQVVWEATGGRRTASMRKVADREKTRAFRKKGKQSIGRQAIGRQETCWQATEISTASRHVLGRKANIKQKYRTVERHAADRDVTHKQRQTERRKAGITQSDLDSGQADNGRLAGNTIARQILHFLLKNMRGGRS